MIRQRVAVVTCATSRAAAGTVPHLADPDGRRTAGQCVVVDGGLLP